MKTENEVETKHTTNREHTPGVLRSLIKEKFLAFSDDSTIHALRNIGKPSNHVIIKIVWILCFLTSGVYCFYSCAQTISNFYSYATTTKLSVVQEIPTLFPAISFCNLKSLDFTNSYTINYINQNAGILNEDTARLVIGNDKNLNDTTRKEMGFKIEDIIDTCTFNTITCNYSDFSYFYSIKYGNCYSFNSGSYLNGSQSKIKTVSSSGATYGLQLILYLGDPTADSFPTNSAGVIVSINNQSIVPFTQGDSVKAAAGTETDIIISRNFNSKLPSPYGDCLLDTSSKSSFSSIYFNYIVKTVGKNYTQEYCYSLCVQQQTIKYCGCANIWIPGFENSSAIYCSSTSELSCMNDLFVLNEDNITTECNQACPFECFSIEYNMISHKARYPTNYVLVNYLLPIYSSYGVTSAEIPEAVVKINVYYHKMQYTVTNQVASMEQADLMGLFGGTLGLFLGMSFLSFVEVIDLAFQLISSIAIYFQSKKKLGKIVDQQDKGAFSKGFEIDKHESMIIS